MLKSFTLIEILIVLSIIAVLSTVLITIIQPAEIFKNARDTQRINDLKNIEKTINLMLINNQSFNEKQYASPNIVYVSLQDSSTICSSWLSQLPLLPYGWSYQCSENPNNLDGTGWIPIPFSQNYLINIPKLPTDPINKPPYFYTFTVGGSYELTAALESESNKGKEELGGNDQGDNNFIYEVGNNKKLTPSSLQARAEPASLKQGLVGWWTFDEGKGTTTYDNSNNNNNGILYNEPQWVDGKIGKALNFNGTSSYINIINQVNFPFSSQDRTVIAWINQFATRSGQQIYHVFHYGNDSFNQAFGLAVYDNAKFGAHEWSSHTRYGNVPLKQWTFIAITLSASGTIKKYYQNDLLLATHTLDAPPNTNLVQTPKIGMRIIPGEYFEGIIDEIRLYNRALSQEEIKTLYEITY